MRCFNHSLLLFALCIPFGPAPAQSLSDATLTSISFDQKLNAHVSTDLPFVDESGRQVRLSEFLDNKPVILVLGYYQCPMLCTLVLNGLVESLEDLKWTIGKEFQVINVSIDPRETAPLAAAKKRSYLRRYGRAGAAPGWHFLTGQQSSIKRIADQVGFQYAYDPGSRQYAHPSGLVILTPKGRIAGYMFGMSYTPADLSTLLQKAASGEISSPIQKLILLCFHYNPIRGKYGPAIMLSIRLLSALTVLGLVGLMITMASRNSVRAEVSSSK